jgi:uncharacterized protein YecE (DUF72 family)
MSEQLDLFGFAPEDKPRAPVSACADEPAILDLTGRLPDRLRLGTSSWSFTGWNGILYAGNPDKAALSRDGLTAYAAHRWLRTVGIDSSFYALPKSARLARYRAAVPADFRFLIKAPALLTDASERGAGGRPIGRNPSFLDTDLAVEQVVAPILEGLGDRMGVLLFQFPPTGMRVTEAPRRFAEDLYRFLRRLPVGPTYAVELRDTELLTRDLAEALRHGGARPGFSVHPRLPGLAEQQTLFRGLPPGPRILRWVLRPNRGYEEARSLYKPFDQLREPDPTNHRLIAALAREALDCGEEVFIIANNKAEGSAPLSLLALAETIAVRRSRGSHPDQADGGDPTSS